MEEEQQENQTKSFGQPDTPGKPQHCWRCMALGCLSPHSHTRPPHDTASPPQSQGGHRGCCFCRKHHIRCGVGCMWGWGGSKHPLCPRLLPASLEAPSKLCPPSQSAQTLKTLLKRRRAGWQLRWRWRCSCSPDSSSSPGIKCQCADRYLGERLSGMSVGCSSR